MLQNAECPYCHYILEYDDDNIEEVRIADSFVHQHDCMENNLFCGAHAP